MAQNSIIKTYDFLKETIATIYSFTEKPEVYVL